MVLKQINVNTKYKINLFRKNVPVTLNSMYKLYVKVKLPMTSPKL